MKEVFHQTQPDTFEKEAKLEVEDLDTLAIEFEARMQPFRKSRTIVRNEDGSRKVYETYRMPLFEEEYLTETYIERFCQEASVLGYRSTISSLIVPGTQKIFGNPNRKRPFIYFFLEKSEIQT